MQVCAAATEPRRYRRTKCDVPGELVFGRWPRRRRAAVCVEDVSPTGVRFRARRPGLVPPAGRAVLRWTVPPDLAPTAPPGRADSPGVLLPRAQAGSRGFRFCGLLDEHLARRAARPRRLLAALAALLVAGAIVFLKSRNLVSFWYGPFWQIYSLLASAYVLSRIGLSILYREPEDRGVVETLSVVVPVKNEQQHITEVVERCFQARYPADKLELIVVDDGSTDGTWEVLRRLAERHPRLRIRRFERNLGKRHAMALGAELARGDILIYMDSDSMIEPEAFYRIIQPFHDGRVGAVAGHTLMIVESDNIFSKFEAVRYFVSFRILKAAESVFGAVTCCPGPFSAYRRQAVLDVLPEWLHQTFLGTPATFGDDRSLTNFILRGYSVVYHAGARAATFAPRGLATFLRQQLRWKKSWVRETTIAARRMWREHPAAVLSYYLGVAVTLVSPLVVLRVIAGSPWLFGSAACLPYLAGLMMVFFLLGIVYYYHTQSRYWYYGFVYAEVYSWLLSLQTYYAVLTVRQNHWGTR
ncbi:MAG: glycosyltransferase [Elusimicrobia bacterium]|nr:glycosyltransferase [Elusimicrobiota bacterium]